MKDYDWMKIAANEEVNDPGTRLEVIAAAMQKAYVMGVADAVKAIDETDLKYSGTGSPYTGPVHEAVHLTRVILRRAVAALIDHRPETWLGRKYTDLRAMFDELITRTKLHGSSLVLKGHTAPETWPFMVIVAVDKTAEQRLIPMLKEFETRLGELAPEACHVELEKWP